MNKGTLNYEKKDNRFLVIAFTLLFILALIGTAWISDDAAITLRTVLNFVHGFGPTFNIDERVQAYTHPLWFFILSFGTLILGNVFYTTFFISISLSTITLGLLLRRVSDDHLAVTLIGTCAILSKAFVDFSTSGLENPLSHLLILLATSLASTHIEKGYNRLTAFFLACSGLYLNRPDLLFIIFPLATYLALSAIRHPKQLATSLSIAAAPVVAWTTFSIFYYGFPFPNTAYAKLGSGIPLDELIIQGIKYLLHSVNRDPVTIFVIAIGIVTGLLGSHLSKSLSFGVILYLIYIVYIGGDFMEGRFLTTPFFMSLVIFSIETQNKSSSTTHQATEKAPPRHYPALIIPILVLGSVNIYPNLIAGSLYSNAKIYDNGIADERGFYYQDTGLLTGKIDSFSHLQWKLSDRKVGVICGGLGFNSIKQGPGMHYIDTCALSDPLLARLPAKENPQWRIGHFIRQLPTNYKESIEQGKNLIIDPKTALYWESIKTVTQGALFDKNRFTEIVKLNFGLTEKPDWQMYRTKYIPRSTFSRVVSESDIKIPKNEGTPWNTHGTIVFDYALEIVLEKKKDIALIDISVDSNDVYEITGLRNHEWIHLATIKPKYFPGLARHKIALESQVDSIEKIRIEAKYGDDDMYSIGHLLVFAK